MRLLILGLDAADPELLDRWMSEDRLPGFSSLRDRGCFGRLTSTINMMTPSAWVSMATGMEPAGHGIFNFVEYIPTCHAIRLADASLRRAPALWEIVGAAGLRSCVLRVPLTFPARPLNGWLVADTLAPSPTHPQFTYPASLARDLIARFGRYGWGETWGDDAPIVTGKYRHAAKLLSRGIDRNFDLLDFALECNDFDFIFAVLHETDEGGHQFWHLMDRESPYYHPELADRYGQYLLQLYQQIDKRLQDLLARLGSHTTVLVVSDHGMGPARPAAWHVRSLLVAAGLQVLREVPPAPPSALPWLRAVKSHITRRIPWQIRRRFRPLSMDLRLSGAIHSLMDNVDWSQTAAFTFVAGYVGEIWINLRGRGPAGIVAPGAESSNIFQRVRELLESAREPTTGKPVVERIHPGTEACPGPFGEAIPDLLVTFDQTLHCEGLVARDPRNGAQLRVDLSSPGAWDLPHYAFHRKEGMILAAGPEISHSTEEVRGSVMDIAPTALYLLGLPIPADLDGRLLEELFSQETLHQRPPLVGPPTEPLLHYQSELSPSEQAAVERRLRTLGYL
ncbi:MAG: alkaline phosphatase family protein [Candidatus Zipacnadales bacterium]